MSLRSSGFQLFCLGRIFIKPLDDRWPAGSLVEARAAPERAMSAKVWPEATAELCVLSRGRVVRRLVTSFSEGMYLKRFSGLLPSRAREEGVSLLRTT